MCIVLSRVLLSLACSLGCISLFFGLVFIWRPWRPLIGRAKSLKLTWTRLRFRILNSAQYRECLATILNGINIHIQLPMRIEPYLTHSYWNTDVLAPWLRSRTGIKRGFVSEPRPNQSRFLVRLDIALEKSFDNFLKALRYVPSLTNILGYPKLVSWGANYMHHLQACVTERLLSNTGGTGTHSNHTRGNDVKVWVSRNRAGRRRSLTKILMVVKFRDTPEELWVDDDRQIPCLSRIMGYRDVVRHQMRFIAKIHVTMASADCAQELQYGMRAQTSSVILLWEGILKPFTLHVFWEECIYNTIMMNYSSTTTSSRMYLSFSPQASNGSGSRPSGEGRDNMDRLRFSREPAQEMLGLIGKL